MAVSKPIGGIAYVVSGGKQMALRGNLVVSPFSEEKTMVTGQDGVHGHTVMPVPPWMEGDFSDINLSFEELQALNAETVTAELVNGKVYVGREGIVEGRPELNTQEGSAKIRWAFKKIEEQKAT